jgi:N-acetylglutamate synthase-like GNAT family acetyltransferase
MLESDMNNSAKFSRRFYLVLFENKMAGVGCLKKIDGATGELQRMYVLPTFRAQWIGRAILQRLISDARSISYSKLKLESLEFLREAHSLYRSVGFKEIEPYPDNSMNSYQSPETIDRYDSITVFMEFSFWYLNGKTVTNLWKIDLSEWRFLVTNYDIVAENEINNLSFYFGHSNCSMLKTCRHRQKNEDHFFRVVRINFYIRYYF